MPTTKRMPVVRKGEQGHVGPYPGALLGAVGAILLGISVAADSGILAIIGGIVLAVGLFAAFTLNHSMVEYEFYRRLEALEKK